MRLKEAIWSLLGQSMETILKKLFIIGSLKILSLEYSIIILIKKKSYSPLLHLLHSEASLGCQLE